MLYYTWIYLYMVVQVYNCIWNTCIFMDILEYTWIYLDPVILGYGASQRDLLLGELEQHHYKVARPLDGKEDM